VINILVLCDLIFNYITGLKSAESEYLSQTILGPTSFTDPDIGPLLVLFEYLNSMEGPLWNRIRGEGFSYHYSIDLRIERGIISFELSEATQLFDAYKCMMDIVEDITQRGFDHDLFMSAKSSSICGLISEEETVEDAANESFINYLSKTTTKESIESILAVTEEAMKIVHQKYLVPHFSKAGLQTSKIFVVTNTGKVDALIQEFSTLSIQFNNVTDISTLLTN